MSPNITRSVCALLAGLCLTVSICTAGENAKDSKQQATLPAEKMQCKVVFTKHVDCEQAARHVRCLFEDEDGVKKATWFAQTGAILLRSTPDEVKQMESLISQIDVPPAETEATEPPVRELRIFSIQYAKAVELAGLVMEIVKRDSSGTSRSCRSASRLRIAVDERTNVIVLMATEVQITKVEKLIKAVDVPVKAQMGHE